MAKKERSGLGSLLLCIPKAAVVVVLSYYVMWVAHNWVDHVREYGLQVKK